MSKNVTTPQAARPRRRRGPSLGTVIAFLITVPIFIFTVRTGQNWYQVKKKDETMKAETQALVKRNLVLAQAHDILQNSKFQVCNKTADEQITVSWIAAVYHDGQKLRSFDSGRCPGWHPRVLVPGDSAMLTFSSQQPGCNWGGPVMFYAIHFVRQSPDPDTPDREYSMTGRWQGFDRDCFTVQ
jgi:hypothetical protein